jgi:hypothetical protein
MFDMKVWEREKARRLRRGEGMAMKAIARELGTARLILHSTFVVQSIYGAIQEYGGFDEPAWLG